MAHAPRSRLSMVTVLLATTAAASLLAGCGQTGGLFSRYNGPEEVQMTASEAAEATSKWATAYAENPKDADVALGYAMTLRALGSKERALDILSTAYRANPDDGRLAAEFGRAALEAGRPDIASKALKTAESKGVDDWKTLSAQGTVYAKAGKHAEAQKYYRAALDKKPDSTSVINNLALSYALDGKAGKAEDLLRQAGDDGHDDKRLRQNLALVLGVQGKFDEARQVASVDMNEVQAKTSVSFLKNMLSKPTKVAAAEPKPEITNDDWSPFGYDEPAPVPAAPPVHTVSHKPSTPEVPKVHVVTPVDEIQAPGKAPKTKAPKTKAPAPVTNPFVQAAAKPKTPATRAKVISVPDMPIIAKPMPVQPMPAKAKAAPQTAASATPAKASAPKPAAPKATKQQAEFVLEIQPPNQTVATKSR